MIPYDYDTFYQYKGTCYSVVTNIETGCPEYIPIKDMKQDIEAIRASASLPLLSKNVVTEAGTAFLIQPKRKSEVGRIEKDKERLKELYEEGFRDGAECYEALIRFLEREF